MPIFELYNLISHVRLGNLVVSLAQTIIPTNSVAVQIMLIQCV